MKLVAGLYTVDHDSEDYLKAHVLEDGKSAYQNDRLKACMEAVARAGHGHSCAIDGGAHIGIWSVQLGKTFMQVHAFEPITENYLCLVKNTEGLNVKCYNAALSDKAGKLSIIQRKANRVKSYSWRLEEAQPDDPNLIPCMTIDSLKLNNVDLIKIDVEGYQYPALMGAIETIKRCRPVIMIEEKFDPTGKARATKLLEDLGLKDTWWRKHDTLYEWPR